MSVLVWGPGEGQPGYNLRRAVRDTLIGAGHDVSFSEDLCRQPGALYDPIDDERLQAECAHLIVMIYGSRGSQSERDMILAEQAYASKSIVLVEQALHRVVTTRALTSRSWEAMSQHAQIIPYDKRHFRRTVSDILTPRTEKMRAALYARSLRQGGLHVT